MMNSLGRFARSAGLPLLVFLPFMSPVARTAPAGAEATPESIVDRWPPRSQSMARLMLEKYGRPGQFDRTALVWFNNGEWKRTIVHRRRAHTDPAVTRTDILEQTVAYLVPEDKIADLKRFNPNLSVSQSAGELTFASESEPRNRLALNLADDIVIGSRTVADARAYFVKALRLAASGKSSSYLDKLRFRVDNTRYMTPSGADR